MLTIDGSQGEGGGQILRTSLALSLVTGQPFRLERIRARRQKPGLHRQHLTAVQAAAAVGCADVIGDTLGSQSLEFRPGCVKPGEYHFAVGTAGSATLVFQTVLPVLLTASKPSILTLEGGTHNPMAPPFDFLQKCFAPLIGKMGPRVELSLQRFGFYPAGGGIFQALIDPTQKLAPLELLECGAICRRQARAIISKIPSHIAERELATVREELGWGTEECVSEDIQNSPGPGNALLVEIESENVTAVFSGIGERGKRAEQVARETSAQVRTWMDANVPVDEHLADQLLLPMALAGGGAFRTTTPTLHSTTNAAIIEQFFPIRFNFEQVAEATWMMCVSATQ